MKIPKLNPNYRAALVLLLMAGILIATSILSDRNDFTSAALVIAGLACMLTGVFFAALSGSDPLDLRYLSLLPVQGSINLVRTSADLGIQGNAHIIPGGRDGRNHPMQFMPVADYTGTPLLTEPFVAGPQTAGLLVEPSCAPLLRLLRERQHLAIPSDMAALHNLVKELGVEVLEVAERVSSTHEGDVITVLMENYRLIDGCRAMIKESPKCCIANPCPVSGLYAAVFAEGTGKVIRIERCAPDENQPNVTAVFSLPAEQ
jgi:hypothetical protein